MAQGSIDKLTIEVEGISSDAARKLDAIAVSLGNLKSASSGLRLTSAANGISKMSAALSSIPADASARVAGLANVLKPLAGIGNIKIGQLGKLPSVMREFSSLNVTSFASQMRQLNTALTPLSASVERLASAYSKMPPSMRAAGVAARSVRSANDNLTRATEKLAAANSNAFKGVKTWMSGLRGGYTTLVSIGHFLKKSLGSVISNVNTYIENMNLFQASMGSAAQSATEFGMKVQEVMGIDFGQWARNQGVFQTLATGMGVTSDKAAVMSQQLTQLGYDISSFYNLPVEEAMLKLQSGLAGELEPLRRIGWDLSNARMNLELAKMGIEGNAQSMTQAEKVALRYKMIMEQVTIVHGDMARTLNSPANQIRILQAQVQLAARAIGNLFIPVLNKILPYAIAAAKAIRMLAQEIANFLHLDVNFEVDYSTLDTSGIATASDDAEDALGGTAAAFDDAGDAAENARKKVKEYQNTVMGFDELNKLNGVQEDTSGDSGSAGSPGIGDLGDGGLGLGDLDVPTYDFLEGLNDKIARLSDEIAKKMVKALKGILPWVAGVGAGLAAWKIGNALISNADKLKEALRQAGIHARTLEDRLRNTKADKLVAPVEKVRSKLEDAAMRFGIMASAPAQAVAKMAPWVAAVALVAGHFANLAVNSENFRRGLEVLRDPAEYLERIFKGVREFASGIAKSIKEWWDNIEVSFPFLKTLREGFETARDAVARFLDGLGVMDALRTLGEFIDGTFAMAMDVFELQWTDAALAVGGFVAIVTGNPVVGGFVLAMEAVSLAIRGIGWATSPVIEKVDALAGVSEETAARFGTSLDSMYDAQMYLAEQQFSDAIVTEEDVARITRDVEDIKNVILDNLDAKRNEELAAIEALSGVLTDEEKQRMIDSVNDFYDRMGNDITNGSNEILQIQTAALAEGRQVTDEENARIREIMDNQYQALLEAAGGSKEELDEVARLSAENQDAAALEAAQNAIQHAAEAREGRKREAQEDYNTTISMLDRMFHDEGSITQEEYDNLARIARDSYEQQERDADAHYDETVRRAQEGLGDLADQFDWEMGQVKENWQRPLNDMLQDWYNFTSEVNKGVDVNVRIAGTYSYDVSGSPLAVARYDTGGFPVEGQLFFARENANPEMVGRMGRKTAVANNAQIVEGIEAGVTNAMLQVLPSFSQGGSSDVNLVLQVDSEELARAVSRGQASAARRGQIKTDLLIA